MSDLFATAETGARVPKKEYEAQLPQLRLDLLNAQYDLRQADFPVFVLVSGDDRVGCNEMVHVLHEWIDARYTDTHVFLQPSAEEAERPPFWRYWQALPRDGRIGIFVGAWALGLVAGRVFGAIDEKSFERRLEHVRRLEAALVDDGAQLLKFWLHLPKEALGRQLRKAEKRRDRSWRAEDGDWAVHERHEEVIPVAERLVRETSVGPCPWSIIESADDRHRNLAVGRQILGALRMRLESASVGSAPAAPAAPAPAPPDPGAAKALSSIDLGSSIDRDKYRRKVDRLQDRIGALTLRAREEGVSGVLVFEGWDAAGKGGVIRRITTAMAVRDYRIVPISAPSEEERAHHYLWRFWRHLPRAGRMLIFDRSWYGRVLVERVEGFAREAEWRRAYEEIRDFEAQLVEHGMYVLKFWLHIDADEQLRRFRARERTAYKKYKLTEDDFRNREKWGAYAAAADEMFARTDTKAAPWHLVPANDKRFARVQVLDAVARSLRKTIRQGKRGHSAFRR